MSSPDTKRPVRARSGLRQAPAPRDKPPNVPGAERSKVRDKRSDARTPHDKDGNQEAAKELAKPPKQH